MLTRNIHQITDKAMESISSVVEYNLKFGSPGYPFTINIDEIKSSLFYESAKVLNITVARLKERIERNITITVLFNNDPYRLLTVMVTVARKFNLNIQEVYELLDNDQLKYLFYILSDQFEYLFIYLTSSVVRVNKKPQCIF